VFWVHASNAARFKQSYRGIADCVKLSGRQDPKANIFKLVHDWLRSTSERWLLVLDNVDDARFLLESQPSGQGQPPLRTYLPRCKHGSMLITSRNKEAALTLVEHRDIVSVEPMDRVQAVALFGKKLGLPGDDSDVAELAAALEYMPLAIVQAAAYIAQRAPRCSVARYLDEFKKSERKRSSLLAHDSSQLQRDWEAKNSIVVTWQISFEHLQQTRPSAADLLSLMSFFDRQNINEGLIHTGARFRHYIAGLKIAKRRLNLAWNRRYFAGERMDDDEESDDEDDTFEDDVVTLRHFCFISIDSTGTAFEMHALVQLATRMWLAANGKLEQWRQKFISILCAIFPTTDNWEVCQALLAHVMSAVGHQPEEQSSLLEWATLLFRAGRIAELRAYVADAEILAVKAMEVRKKVLGEDHEDTLWSMEVAGTVHKLGGRLKEAEELLVQVMDTHKAKLGADHLATLNSMGHVAGVYLEQGRWDEAEKLLVQATETLKTKLGVDHSKTVISMSHLGLTYRSQGRWDAAEKLEVQVLEVLKIRHGVNHPDTLIVMGVLSLIYQEQGRHNESEKLGEQALELSKVKLGVDHIETLIIMGNMSLTYWSQGRWDDAEKLAEQVMEMRKAKLGANHPHTLASMSIYAFILEGRGSILRAMSLMEDCHKRRVEVLGAQHPSTLDSREMLARWHPKVIER
jgi:tetratricopeptide (TPR) repeat protein